MSLCPDCHQETGTGDFCRACFRALAPAAAGRFAPLLEQGLCRPTPPPQWAGPDLLAVTVPTRRGKVRAKFLGKLNQLAGLALILALGGGGLYLHQKQRYREGVQHRLSGIALTRQGDFEGARRQLEAAPDEAETYRARAELAVAEGDWLKAAELFGKISVDDAEVNAHVDTAAQERAQTLIKEARQSADTARALVLSDQAETLLEEHQARPEQRAAVHFLRATLYKRLELGTEAIAELRIALQLDPAHGQARQLLAQLSPRPVAEAPLTHRPTAAPPSHPGVEVPRMQTQPDYPTYQPPEEDSEDELESPETRRAGLKPNRKRRRR